ncbi:MAG: hypothetical protein V1804_03885 [Patescibacteria group bacterium]
MFRNKLSLILISLILSAVAFLFILGNYRNYESEISIIFIPKSEKAASDSGNIIGNLEVFPTKLSFYEKLIKDNKLEDKFSGLSDNKRKKLWDEMIKAKKEKKSSIVKITAVSQSPGEAKLISNATVSTLFSVVSFYYDIKNDVDLRIIEEPAVRPAFDNWVLAILISLAIGTGISFILGFISSYFLQKSREIKISFPKFDFGKKPKIEIPVEENYFKELEKLPETQEKKPEETKPKIPAKISSAPENLPGVSNVPGNLPFIDEEYFRNNIIKNAKPVKESIAEQREIKEEIKPEKQTAASKKESVNFHREPTQEELKKRLNQLLKGEL